MLMILNQQQQMYVSVAVPRIQFLAVEIARNREGCNAGLRRLFSRHKDSAKQNDVSPSTSVH